MGEGLALPNGARPDYSQLIASQKGVDLVMVDVGAVRNRVRGSNRCFPDFEVRLTVWRAGHRQRHEAVQMDTATAPSWRSFGSARTRTSAHELLIEAAWPWDWENRPEKDDCTHEWEIVVVARLFDPNERVARCTHCHTPRCGYAEDSDPCHRRRHHEGEHVTGSNLT